MRFAIFCSLGVLSSSACCQEDCDAALPAVHNRRTLVWVGGWNDTIPVLDSSLVDRHTCSEDSLGCRPSSQLQCTLLSYYYYSVVLRTALLYNTIILTALVPSRSNQIRPRTTSTTYQQSRNSPSMFAACPLSPASSRSTKTGCHPTTHGSRPPRQQQQGIPHPCCGGHGRVRYRQQQQQRRRHTGGRRGRRRGTAAQCPNSTWGGVGRPGRARQRHREPTRESSE